MGSTRTDLSTSTLSPSDDAVVELKPPAEFGFSGTAKLLARSDSVLIAELQKRGYTVVTQKS